MTSENISLVERARRYLMKCPPAVSGQGGHNTTFRMACVLVHGFSLPAQDALTVLQEWNRTCQPPWSESELRHKVASAMAASSQRAPGYLLGQKTGGTVKLKAPGAALKPFPASEKFKAEFMPETLKRAAARVQGVDFQFFKDRSPLCPDTQTPASFLHHLYLIKPVAIRLGADKGCITAVRLTRLPGCYRGEDGPPPISAPAPRPAQDAPLEFDAHGDPILTPTCVEKPPCPWTGGILQELIYLNPNPDDEPIFNRKTREQIHAEWLAKLDAQPSENV